jgi:hypothetical protein
MMMRGYGSSRRHLNRSQCFRTESPQQNWDIENSRPETGARNWPDVARNPETAQQRLAMVSLTRGNVA